MATVSKNFRVKDGLIVEGSVGTIDGSNILTEDATQVLNNKTLGTALNADNNSVTNLGAPVNPLDATNKQYVDALDLAINEKVDDLDLAINQKVDDLTTAEIAEDPNFLYFTNQRAIDAVGGAATPENTPLTVVKRDASGNFAAGVISAESLDASVDITTPELATPLVVVQDELAASTGTVAGVTGNLEVSASNTLNLKAVADIELTADVDVIISADNDITLGAVNGDVSLTPGGIATVNNDEIVTITAAQTVTNKVIGSGTTLGADLDASGNKVVNVGTPDNDNDAATKGYVDAAISGLDWKTAVNLFADSNVALTGDTNTLVIDGHSALDSTDDGSYRLLLTNQTTATENGIYVYTDNGTTYTLVRSEDADTVAELETAAVFVKEGTTYGSTSWVQSDHYATTFDQLLWSQFSGTGTITEGVGIDINGREVSVDLSELSTTTLPEGDNLYYTDERVDDRVASLVQGGKGITVEYDDAGGLLSLSTEFSEFTTTDIVEGDKLFFTSQRAYDAINDSTTINFVEVDINSVATQVAAQGTTTGSGGAETVYQFAKADYRSAKFIVKLARGTHTQVSEVLVTLDTSDNVAITEYAIVGTNGNLGDVWAVLDGANVALTVDSGVELTGVTVMGTLLA